MEPNTEITKSLINIDSKILEKVYDDVLSPGAKKVGFALETALGLGNTVLLPIKLLNEKTNLLFKKHMNSFQTKLDEIPKEKLISAPPEIAVPILDKLTYTVNEELAELYINLLKSASCEDSVQKAHVAFVSIITNLTPDEIKILDFIYHIGRLPTLTSKIFDTAGEELIVKKDKMTGLEITEGLIFPENTVIYFNNLIGLGLLEHCVDKDSEIHLYDEVFAVHRKFAKSYIDEFLKENEKYLERRLADNKEENVYTDDLYQITTDKGYYNLSEYGYKFIEACR